MQGLIALDIDGTTVAPGFPIPIEVISFLSDLTKKGWLLIFITGRSLQLAHQLLHAIPFPYFLAVQNGAILLEMPDRKIINKRYLEREIFPIMEEICASEPSDFVVYAGCEYEDLCYYRPHHFDHDLLEYLKIRTHICSERWLPVTSFDSSIPSFFASVKCFGSYDSAQNIANRIEQKLNLHTPVIRDPFNSDYFVAQATHPEVNKGYALKDLQRYLDHKGIMIAAGDDFNDVPLFEAADIKVVMNTAPQPLQAYADIIAPSAADNGIIVGLQLAIKQSNYH